MINCLHHSLFPLQWKSLYLSHVRVCVCLCSGCMQDLRWISGAVAWSCTLCCAGRCPSMMTTCQRFSRRSVMGSSSLHSTWTLQLSAFSNTCCRWTPWREPPLRRSGEILFFRTRTRMFVFTQKRKTNFFLCSYANQIFFLKCCHFLLFKKLDMMEYFEQVDAMAHLKYSLGLSWTWI